MKQYSFLQEISKSRLMASTGQLSPKNLQRLRDAGTLPDTERMVAGMDRGSKNMISKYAKTNKTKVAIVPTSINDVQNIRTVVHPTASLQIPSWSDKTPLSAIVRRHEVDELRNSGSSIAKLNKALDSHGLNKMFYAPGEERMIMGKLQSHGLTDRGGHYSNNVIANEIDNARKFKNYTGYDMGSDQSNTGKFVAKARSDFNTLSAFGPDASSQPVRELHKRAVKLDKKAAVTLDRRLKTEFPMIDEDFKLIYRVHKKRIWAILFATGISVGVIAAYLTHKIKQEKKQKAEMKAGIPDDVSKGII